MKGKRIPKHFFGEEPVTDPLKKRCAKCRQVKVLADDFHANKAKPDGRYDQCKVCIRTYQRNRNQGKTPGAWRKPLEERKVSEEKQAIILKMVEMFIENPHVGYGELTRKLGPDRMTLNRYMNEFPTLKLLRTRAATRVSQMIPLALDGLEKSLKSQNADVQYKSSVKVLENEMVMAGDRVELNVNDLSQVPTEKLLEIAQQAQAVPAPTIVDVEAIS